jgi:hypothetical protein
MGLKLSLTLHGHKLRLFNNTAPRRIFASRREEVYRRLNKSL